MNISVRLSDKDNIEDIVALRYEKLGFVHSDAYMEMNIDY